MLLFGMPGIAYILGVRLNYQLPVNIKLVYRG